MFSEELKALLWGVVTSWQVITVTVVLIFYFMLVNYVAQLRRRPRAVSKEFGTKGAKNTSKSGAPAAEVEVAETDDLGIEEGEKENR
ncbi:MAG: hypothetical protein LBP42_01215 [Treponema sp.]|jgi:heme/copper-type cytochrome/quinol oxidase subunit 2|nr:hypothetical protein [Treponema sp.]